MNRTYLTNIGITTALTAAALYCWNYFMPQYSNQHAWFIIAYYVIATLLVHQWLVKRNEPKKFIMRFMGVTGIKLMLNLVIILVYGLNFRSKAVSFALMFMVIYFIYTFFESTQLIKLFNQKKEKS